MLIVMQTTMLTFILYALTSVQISCLSLCYFSNCHSICRGNPFMKGGEYPISKSHSLALETNEYLL